MKIMFGLRPDWSFRWPKFHFRAVFPFTFFCETVPRLRVHDAILDLSDFQNLFSLNFLLIPNLDICQITGAIFYAESIESNLNVQQQVYFEHI